MLAGRQAFCQPVRELLFRDIVNGFFRFDPSVTWSFQAKQLISSLLQVAPNSRLGARGIREIMDHPFFASTDWNGLLSKSVAPPIRIQPQTPSPSPYNPPDLDEETGVRGANVDNFTHAEESRENWESRNNMFRNR